MYQNLRRTIFVLDRMRSYSDPIRHDIYTNREIRLIIGRLPELYSKKNRFNFIFIKYILLIIQFLKVPVSLKIILVRILRFLKIL